MINWLDEMFWAATSTAPTRISNVSIKQHLEEEESHQAKFKALLIAYDMYVKITQPLNGGILVLGFLGISSGQALAKRVKQKARKKLHQTA